MGCGFAYLVAIMDWESRAVLSWSISNTADTRFCLEALAEAVEVAGRLPDIFNTDQGCQFTSREWTGTLEDFGVKVSMGGKGRWKDNDFHRAAVAQPEERGHLSAGLPESGATGGRRHAVDGDYNRERIHEGLDYAMSRSIYRPQPELAEAA